MVVRREVMHGLSNMDFYSPRPAWVRPLLSVQSASSRDQCCIPYMAPFPGVISLVAGWLLWNCFYHGKGSICFYWNRYSKYGFAFPTCNASAKTINMDLQNDYPPSWYCAQHCFWPAEFTSQKWSAAIGPCSRSPLALLCALPSWSRWLDGMVE